MSRPKQTTDRRRIRDRKGLMKALKELGVEVTYTGKEHLRVSTPSGPVIIPSTPSAGRRSVLNAVAQLRRSGLDL